MSNQKFRAEEPEVPTRETRLAAARALIAAESAKGAQLAEVIRNGVGTMYRDHGGNALDLQIKGMALVIEEGNIYREEQIEYKAQMKAYYAGKRASEPWPPGKPGVSAATMVSASRQLEILRERANRLYEDMQIEMAELLLNREAKKNTPPEENRTPTEPEAPKEAAAKTEDTTPKRDNHAATAAA